MKQTAYISDITLWQDTIHPDPAICSRTSLHKFVQFVIFETMKYFSSQHSIDVVLN